jgi:hypothetical protein
MLLEKVYLHDIPTLSDYKQLFFCEKHLKNLIVEDFKRETRDIDLLKILLKVEISKINNACLCGYCESKLIIANTGNSIRILGHFFSLRV